MYLGNVQKTRLTHVSMGQTELSRFILWVLYILHILNVRVRDIQQLKTYRDFSVEVTEITFTEIIENWLALHDCTSFFISLPCSTVLGYHNGRLQQFLTHFFKNGNPRMSPTSIFENEMFFTFFLLKNASILRHWLEENMAI